jgi:hypothetical protein
VFVATVKRALVGWSAQSLARRSLPALFPQKV